MVHPVFDHLVRSSALSPLSDVPPYPVEDDVPEEDSAPYLEVLPYPLNIDNKIR